MAAFNQAYAYRQNVIQNNIPFSLERCVDLMQMWRGCYDSNELQRIMATLGIPNQLYMTYSYADTIHMYSVNSIAPTSMSHRTFTLDEMLREYHGMKYCGQLYPNDYSCVPATVKKRTVEISYVDNDWVVRAGNEFLEFQTEAALTKFLAKENVYPVWVGEGLPPLSKLEWVDEQDEF